MFKRDSVSVAINSRNRRRYLRLGIRPGVLRHWLVLVTVVIGTLALLYFSRPVAAVTRTWDGGGVTNNWSEAANWSGDVAPDPLGADFVIFDGTSSKNVTVNVPVIVSGFQINSPYAGEISQGSSNVTVNGASSQSSGTFAGGSGVIDFNSNFTLSGGTFSASSTTTSFTTNFTQTGGTFAPNGGTVVFDGGGDSFVSVPTSLTLNNVTVDKTGAGRLVIESGDTLVVACSPQPSCVPGTLALTNGQVVSSGGSPATLEAQGAVSIASTFDGGDINLLISGATTRTVTLPTGVFLPPLTVNAPGVTVNTSGAGPITFTQAVSIQNVALFTNGTVDLTFNAGVPFAQSGGTFTGGSGLIDFNGNFTLTGGTFTASSTTTAFAATFTPRGTFAPNGGTVVFDGGGDTGIDLGAASGLPGSLTLNNVTVNKTGGRVVIQGDPDTLVVAGTLTLTEGQVVVNGVNATLEAQGDVSIASTFDGGNIILLISGAATRTITLGAGALLPRLTVNAPNVTVNASGAGAITFTQPVAIQSVALFTNGTVDLTFDAGVTFTQSGGTFTGGSGLIDFNSTFSLSGGTFGASSITTSFAATFTQTGGTFAPNGGTVVFDGSGESPLLLSTSLTLNNLTVNKPNNVAVRIDSQVTLVVAGTLTLTDGVVDKNGGLATTTLEAQGDVAIASTFDGGSVNFRFGGSANQTYTNLGGSNVTSSWTVDKPAGAVTLASNLILNNNQPLTITSGRLDQGASFNLQTSNTLTVGANGILRNFGTGNITLGGNVSNSGVINLNGGGTACGDPSPSDLLQIRSTVDSTVRTWSGPGAFSVVDVDANSQAAGTPPGTITAFGSSVLGPNMGAGWATDLTDPDDCPVITTNPNNQNPCLGGSVSFSVTTTGTGLTFQWFKGPTLLSNGGNISGANSDTLTINPVGAGDAGSYNVVVTNSFGVTASSNPATLTIAAPPSITDDPDSATVCEGDPVTFTAAATGAGPLTFQWRKNMNPITGATGSSFTINSVAAGDAGAYDVVVTGACSPPATSAPATLTVNTLPVITQQPTDQTTCVGGSASFSVTATGTALTFQWRRNGTPLSNGGNISGADTATLTIDPVSESDAAPSGTGYDVVVSGACSPAVTSTRRALAVNTPDLAIDKSHTGDFTVGTEGVYTISVTNSGSCSTTGTITVIDSLPNGLSFISGTGAGWSCSATGQDVTCTNAGPLAASGVSTITLTVGVAQAAVPGVTNTADVSTSDDGNAANNSDSDTTTVNGSGGTVNLTVNTLGDAADLTLDGNCDTDAVTAGDQCTLRAAIQETNNIPSDDFINFSLLPNSTITLTGQLDDIDGNLIINGPSSGLTVSGNNLFRVFTVLSGKTVSISRLTIANGRSSGGGGIFNRGNLTISNSTFTGNNAVGGSGEGGAINSEGGTLTIVNTTISGNTAETDGGGLLNSGDSMAVLTNVTITNNRADSDGNLTGAGGGIGQVSSNSITLNNTIVAGNVLGASPGPTADDVSGNLDASSLNNLIGVDTGLTGINDGSGGNQIGTSGSPITARLGALANNGGPTQTHALLAGSPALDAGSNTASDAAGLTTDQRGTGFLRKRDAGSDADTTQTVDIGAFEANPSVEDIPDKATAEDTALPTFSFNVGDSATAFDSITATSSDTTLVPNANIIVSGSGSTRNLSITPAANQSGTTTITVTATKTISGTVISMSDTFLLTVGAVPDTPSVTNAATNEDTQTTSGLVIDRNAADGAEVTHFKITGISNGTLFKNNGTTQINNSDFITVAEGQAGLKFTPPANSFANGSFQVQASTDAVGTSLSAGAATAIITVNPIADTPSVTNATTNEDTQTTTGLVISRNAVDGAEVTHFKITGITNGTLFKNNGTTQINNGAFITFAEGNAGLRFTPAANLFSPSTTFSFQVQAATSAAGAGLSSGFATATITVDTVADTPSVTNATTNEDAQTTSGLVITRNSADGAEVTHFKITGITGGTLFQNNGSTPINNGDFITVAQGAAGLKFTPALNSNVNGSFQVQASLNNTNGGLGGGLATATITVNAVNDAPVNTVPGAQSMNENSTLNFSTANSNLISIADLDAGAAAVRVTLTATNGAITLNGTTGLSFTVGDGTADATMTFTGTIAAINPALNGMTFTSTPSFDGAASLQIVTNDQGNTGSGGAQTDTDTVNITVIDGGTLAFSSTTYAVDESGPSATITVNRTGGSSGEARVDYTTSNGTATSSDYTTASGTLIFANGVTTQTFNVPITNDALDEADETVNLTLSNAQGTGALGTPATAVLTITDNDDTSVFQLSSSTYSVNEGDGRATITVNRVGASSQPARVDYATSDTSGLNLCSQITGNASERCDYATVVGTLRFAAGESSKTIPIPIVDDVYLDGPEVFKLTLSNEVGAEIGAPSEATITIIDNDTAPAANAIDNDEFFIRQLYIDFLGREPEPQGLADWLAILNHCAIPTDCDRIAVAQGFVRSPEFQDRGYFIYRHSSAALGRIPIYPEFIPDMAKLSGFLSPSDLEANKEAYIQEFMNRPEFLAIYGSTLNDPTAYVDKLLQTAVLPNHPGRAGWIAGLTNQTLTNAQVLRQFIESTEVSTKYVNEAFIIMNYFGFLRRTADAAYLVWIDILNQTNDDRLIINGFLNSPEYRLRFGP